MCYSNSFNFSVALVNGTIQHHTSHIKGIFGQKGILLVFLLIKKFNILLSHIYLAKHKYVPFSSEFSQANKNRLIIIDKKILSKQKKTQKPHIKNNEQKLALRNTTKSRQQSSLLSCCVLGAPSIRPGFWTSGLCPFLIH